MTCDISAFHDLRHSCLSLLNFEKFTMKDLQSYARHEDMATTQEFYAHTYDETKLKMQNAICKHLFETEHENKQEDN